MMQNITKPNRNITKLNHTKSENTKLGITRTFAIPYKTQMDFTKILAIRTVSQLRTDICSCFIIIDKDSFVDSMTHRHLDI